MPDTNIVGDVTDAEEKHDAVLRAKNAADISALDIGGGSKKASAAVERMKGLQEGLIGQEAALQKQMQARDEDYRGRMEQANAAAGAGIADLKPWNAEAEMGARKHDLWEQFGSPGFVISMLASAFTAMPMNSALNAGAAAMNAINQGDTDAYNKAFGAWKDNANLAIKRSEMEQKAFDNIAHLRQSNMEDWRQQAALLLQQFNDQRKLALLNSGYDKDLLDAQTAEWESRDRMALAIPHIIESNTLLNAVNGDPRWKSGDPKQMMAAYTDAAKQIQEAKYAGRYGSNMTLSRLQEVAIADRAQEIIKQGQAEGKTISTSDAITQAAQEIRPAFSQPRSPGAMALSKYLQRHPKATDADVIQFNKDFTTIMSRARSLGVRSSNVDVAVDEAVGAAKQALDASKNVPRGNWVPINQLTQLVREKKSSPEQQRFDIANAALVTAYAQTMSRTGVNSVFAQRRALDVLQTATGPDAYEAGVDQLMTEMQIVKSAVRAAEQEDGHGGSAPSAPKKGDVQDGYRFNGGDPANPDNWEKQ